MPIVLSLNASNVIYLHFVSQWWFCKKREFAAKCVVYRDSPRMSLREKNSPRDPLKRKEKMPKVAHSLNEDCERLSSLGRPGKWRPKFRSNEGVTPHGWKTTHLLGWPIFRGEPVTLPESIMVCHLWTGRFCRLVWSIARSHDLSPKKVI